eukprot:scaffold2549_cov108-Isochrysis_galbana.AAC.13
MPLPHSATDGCKRQFCTLGPFLAQPTLGPFLAQPTLGPFLAQPTLGPFLAQPTLGPFLAQPTLGPFLAQPTLGPFLPQPTLGPFLAQPTLEPFLAQPKPIRRPSCAPPPCPLPPLLDTQRAARALVNCRKLASERMSLKTAARPKSATCSSSKRPSAAAEFRQNPNRAVWPLPPHRSAAPRSHAQHRPRGPPSHLGVVLLVQQDVLWLQISVVDPVMVAVVERLCDGRGEHSGLATAPQHNPATLEERNNSCRRARNARRPTRGRRDACKAQPWPAQPQRGSPRGSAQSIFWRRPRRAPHTLRCDRRARHPGIAP